MFKKLSISVLSLGLLVVAAGPALAFYMPGNVNIADVRSNTEATAISGNNSQSSIVFVEKACNVVALSGQGMGNQSITSGNSYSNAESLNVVNARVGWGMGSDMNMAKVSSNVYSGAQSGGNMQDQVTDVSKAHNVVAGSMDMGGSSTIRTGVSSSMARNTNLVNVRLSW